MKRLSLTAWAIAVFSLSLPLAAAPAAPPHYRISAVVSPADGEIRADVTLTGLEQLPAGARLYLDRTFTLDEARLDGKKTALGLDLAAEPGPYMPRSAPLALPAGSFHTLHLRYHGRLAEMINDVNTISPHLVELAIYAGWYPASIKMPGFTYELTLHLPPGWGVITNGRPQGGRTGAGVSRWASLAPTDDIAVVAAPDLQIRRVESGGAELQVAAVAALSPRTPPLLERMAAGLATAVQWFGPAGGRLYLAFPPRKGWGYSRIPMIVGTGQYGEDLVKDPGDIARKLYGVYHEMAHFWWMIAPTDTPDDWINESLAEFTAWRLLREAAGSAPAARLEARYRKSALDPQAAVPITQTMEEPARYINRYEKGALLFIALERRFGWTRLQALLQRILGEGRGRRMDTAGFLVAVRAGLGEEAGSFLERFLQAPGWTEAMLGEIPADPASS